jgi:hypothetical protein
MNGRIYKLICESVQIGKIKYGLIGHQIYRGVATKQIAAPSANLERRFHLASYSYLSAHGLVFRLKHQTSLSKIVKTKKFQKIMYGR